MAAFTSFRTYFANISPSWLQGPFGSKFVAGAIALMGDSIQAIATLGLRAPWTKLEGPDDALSLVGEGSNIEKYFSETFAQYRIRLNDRWDTWTIAGNDSQLVQEVVNIGFPNAALFDATDWPNRLPTTGLSPDGSTIPYWSQFWILIPATDHNFTAGELYGAATYGQFTYGIQGIDVGLFVQTIRDAVCKYKPGHTVLRQIIFENPSSGFTYATGDFWGDPGLKFGSDDNIAVSGC